MSHTQSLTPSAPAVESPPEAVLAAFLARLFLVELDEESHAALTDQGLLESLEMLEPGCAFYLSGRPWSAEDFDEAAADYCDLFLLPTGALPRASLWMGGEPMEHGPRLVARISEIATALGVDPQQIGDIPPDHLGILLSLVTVAWEEDPSGAAALQKELLGPWVPSFSAAVLQKAKNPLYRAAARLLLEFVVDD